MKIDSVQSVAKETVKTMITLKSGNCLIIFKSGYSVELSTDYKFWFRNEIGTKDAIQAECDTLADLINDI